MIHNRTVTPAPRGGAASDGRTARVQPYRLSIDLGSNSIGWCVLDLGRPDPDDQGRIKPKGIRALGARLFSDGRDPQDKSSLAAGRRLARQMRRRRDRLLRRRADLMAGLVRHGLMPADPAARKALETAEDTRDPFALRARGLSEALAPFAFGRALFHLNQRRGFKAMRTATKVDEEAGLIRAGTDRLEAELADAGGLTLGTWMAGRLAEGRSVRARMDGAGREASYPFYPARRMLEVEFDRLWTAQAAHHPTLLTEAARAEIRHVIFFQRPLKDPPVGKCGLRPEEERAPRALPSAQRLRLYQELANLRVIAEDRSERPLSVAERDRVVATLLGRPAKRSRKPPRIPRTLTFEKIRGLLELPPGTLFSLQSERRPELVGDETGVRLSKALPDWPSRPLAEQDAIVEALWAGKEEEATVAALRAGWGFDAETATALAGVTLPDFHMRYGRTAIRDLLRVLEAETRTDPDGRVRPIRIDEAVTAYRGGRNHSDVGRAKDDPLLPELPYYGRVLERHVAFGTGEPKHPEEKRLGKVANPTVHIALNQLRKVVNALIKRYGHPAQIVVELARDLKQSAEDRRRQEKRQAEDQKRNEARRAFLAALGVPVTARNVLKLRLWEEQGPTPQDRLCPYTGRPISVALLLSEQVDIDHILPFSATLDDSAANKVVCMREANREKRNRTPHDAFGPDAPGHDPRRWAEILARAALLPGNKRWRFGADALARFEDGEGFQARHLNDTRYLSRLAREYLEHICDDVRVSPGRLTALLRRRWGIDSILDPERAVGADVPAVKNRADHRHHALDAAVIGCIDHGMVNRIQREAGRAEADSAAREEGLRRVLAGFAEPWPGFREDLARRTDRLVVSHRPEHGTGGALHKETAYGPVDPPEEVPGEGRFNLVTRKPVAGLSEDEAKVIRNPKLREALAARLEARRRDANDFKGRLAKAAGDLTDDPAWRHVRRVRVLKKEANPIRIDHGGGRFTKRLLAGELHHLDLAVAADGRRWVGHFVTVYDAHRGRDRNGNAAPPRLGEGERFLMRLHKGDYLSLEHAGRRRLMLVVKLEPSGDRVILVEPQQQRSEVKLHVRVSCNKLKERGARLVTVDVLGRVTPRPFGTLLGVTRAPGDATPGATEAPL